VDSAWEQDSGDTWKMPACTVPHIAPSSIGRHRWKWHRKASQSSAVRGGRCYFNRQTFRSTRIKSHLLKPPTLLLNCLVSFYSRHTYPHERHCGLCIHIIEPHSGQIHFWFSFLTKWIMPISLMLIRLSITLVPYLFL
jgi:hypothetical protein